MAIPFAHTSLPNLLNLYPLTNSSPSLRLWVPSPCRSAITSKSLLFPFSRFPVNKVHTLTKASSSFTVSEITDILDDLGSDGDGDDDLAGSPWEGAIVYHRDASVSHVEYCTTLERLGLGKLSSEVSRLRAADMGIRLPMRRPKNSTFGDEETPVLVSLDITKRKRRLRLDGIVRTVITLGCNRCNLLSYTRIYQFVLSELIETVTGNWLRSICYKLAVTLDYFSEYGEPVSQSMYMR